MPASDLGERRRARLLDARLYLVCDSSPGLRPLERVLTAAIRGGVQIVQLREKTMPASDLVRAALRARAVCEREGALLIVDDHPDVALAAGADGVHLGQDDMAPGTARELLGPDMLIGLSTHSPEEIGAAGTLDYIGVGPVFATPTKPGRPAVGLELVRHAATHSPLPFFAIGGIDAGNIRGVLAAGSRRVAVVRAIAHAPDPRGAARRLREALDGSDLLPRPTCAPAAHRAGGPGRRALPVTQAGAL